MPDLVHSLDVFIFLLQVSNGGSHMQQRMIQFFLLVQVGARNRRALFSGHLGVIF